MGTRSRLRGVVDAVRRHGWPAVLVLAAAWPPAPARAADLQVAPTLVTIAPGRAADGLMLRNSGPHPLTAQVRVFAWRQVAGEDQLAETDDLAVSPPMIDIAPGAEQLVRIVRRIAPPETVEGSYRVIVDEVPDPGRTAPVETGLDFVFRYSVPVFLEPALPAAPILHARLVDGPQGRALEIENTGTARAQIADIVHVAPGTRQVVAAGLAGYVLPGRQRRWPLPPAARPGAATDIQARINGEPDARTLLPDR